jgi:transposase InsO family protein
MKRAIDIGHIKNERAYWKTVELSCLSDSEQLLFLQRKKAVDMYIDGYTIKQITEETKIKGKAEAQRLLLRCLSCDDYGAYKGYTALIPYKHLTIQNKRKQEQNIFTTENSSTGMFSFMLTEYPDIKEYIDALYFGKVKTTLEKNISVRILHQLFLKKCQQVGIKEYEYPFSVQSKGLRSLYDYINKLKINNPSMISSRLSNDAIEKLNTTGISQPLMIPEIRPFSVVQIDGHKIDCITTIDVMTPKGDKETKTIQRFWILTLIDVATRTILGYHLTVKSAYDRFDVLKCVEDAILPKQLMNFEIPGLVYPENTGYHSIAIPDSRWAIFDELMLDNALAHLSKDVINQVTTFLNATLNFGPVASPERRGIIERFYQTLESRGYHRLASTTGTGINDARRKGAEKDAIKYGITFQHISEITEVLIAQYNSTPHSANNGFTPLEVMQQRMSKGLLPNYMEQEKRENFMLNYITVTRKICGKLGTGRRPYVNFEGAEYRSEVLSKSFQLVGHKLILKFNPDDIRICKAFFEDGSEFCDLYVVGQWRNQPHSLAQRKEANKVLSEKKLQDNNFIDPIQTYDDYLTNESLTSKRARNKLASRQLTKETVNTLDSNNKEIEPDMEHTNINKTNSKRNKKNNNSSNVFTPDELEARFKNQTYQIKY